MASPGPRNSFHRQSSNELCSGEMLQHRECLSFPCNRMTRFFVTFTGLAGTAASGLPR